MSYAHRLTLAFKHCRAYLRHKATPRSGSFSASWRRSSWAAAARTRLKRTHAQAQAQASRLAQASACRMAQASACRMAQASARRMARTARVHGAALRSMSCRSRLTRWGRWLGQSILYSVALTALVCGIGAAVAGGSWESRPQGFTELSTVAEIQSSGFDDQEVQIKGRLTNYLYKDYYEFTDELGNSIEVELDDDVDWSPVHKDQLIAIYGEVERNLFKISIDAKSYRILEEMPAPAAAAAPAAAETTEAPASSLESEELPLENSDDAQNVHLLVDEAATGIKLERINYELP